MLRKCKKTEKFSICFFVRAFTADKPWIHYSSKAVLSQKFTDLAGRSLKNMNVYFSAKQNKDICNQVFRDGWLAAACLGV